MIPPKSLGLGLVLAAYIHTAAARQSLSNPYQGCEFTVDRSRYDLCPLFHDRGQGGVVKVHAELAPTTQLYYEISFGGPLSPQRGEDAQPQVRTGEAATLHATNECRADSCSSVPQVHGFV